MRQESNAYDSGRSAFFRGKLRKPTNDTSFMRRVDSILGNEISSIREAKEAVINEWKHGWDEAKIEANEEAAPKPAKKKAKKKSKRKAKR